MLHRAVVGRVRLPSKPPQLSSPPSWRHGSTLVPQPASQRDSTGCAPQLLRASRLEREAEQRAETTQIKLLVVWQEGGVSCGLLAPPPGLSPPAALPTHIQLPGTRWLLPGQEFVPWASRPWHALPADRSPPVCSRCEEPLIRARGGGSLAHFPRVLPEWKQPEPGEISWIPAPDGTPHSGGVWTILCPSEAKQGTQQQCLSLWFLPQSRAPRHRPGCSRGGAKRLES